MPESKYYKMKHIPTGLYFQPCKHRGSHLSKKGKIYQTDKHGVKTVSKSNIFTVFCQKNSQIHKTSSNVLNWVNSYNNSEVKAETNIDDWVKEYVNDDTVEKVLYTKEDMIKASKYGYNFHKTTQFPNQEFEDSCINNTKQWLTTLKK